MRTSYLPVVIVAAAFSATSASAQSTLPSCERYPLDQERYDCSCGGDEEGSVWGSGPYTSDSDVCAAARHAGVIDRMGGNVEAILGGGLDAFPGSEANGVATRDWGAYDSSFLFNPKGPMGTTVAGGACGDFPVADGMVTCACSGDEDGSVWGSDPYTADSDICTAARHTGVIGPSGGTVTALGVMGLEQYVGTNLNGVTTRDWGAYGDSFTFDFNQ